MLSQRLRLALDEPSDEDSLPADLVEQSDLAGTPAAVLIAVTDRPRPGVILTVRREDMRTHAGQIAFPGGRIDGDEGAPVAALREAQEELGLDPSAVELIGALASYRTVTGFSVTPVIGTVPPDLPLVANEAEVSDWFEAPLDYLLDPANQRRRSVLFEGQERHYYEIEWKERRIWGATAAMLVNLSRRLQWS